MTIAVCYLTSEGVVLGADSTTTFDGMYSPHYLNHSQKIFEVGEGGTLAAVTWGLGALAQYSHREMVARLGDVIARLRVRTVADAATRWLKMLIRAYEPIVEQHREALRRFDVLRVLLPFAPGDPTNAGRRSEIEEREYRQLNEHLGNFAVGYFLGGHLLPARSPAAYEVVLDMRQWPPPPPRPLPVDDASLRGVPTMMDRLFFGFDPRIRSDILESGRWQGGSDDLDDLLRRYVLRPHRLPMREVVDWVHTCVYCTAKAIKFSHLPQTVGGPIEVAVITVDRKFRWVRHKEWDSAISDGDNDA